MVEQGSRVMLKAGATGSMGQTTSNALKACNTSYRASYCDRLKDTRDANLPVSLKHLNGSGFTANQRPAIFYRPSLDYTDNPSFGAHSLPRKPSIMSVCSVNTWMDYHMSPAAPSVLLLSDSFMSQTKRHYQPCIRTDFLGPLPNLINKPRSSSFYQLCSHPKTVSAMEKKTEYQRQFLPHRVAPTVFLDHVIIGPKEETGFTEEKDLQLNTFQEKNRCTVEPRQIPNSVMRDDFVPPSFLKGKPGMLDLCSRSCRETGFTRGVIAPLACPTSLLPTPNTKINTSVGKTIGKKEPTGFLLNAPNNQVFPNTAFDCSHFTSHYTTKFCNDANVEKIRSGPTGTGIISAKMVSGYNRQNMDRFILRG